MASQAQAVLIEALQLSRKDRTRVAAALLDTLDDDSAVESQRDLDLAWTKEIDRRVREIEAGTAKLVPWDQVRRELHLALKQKPRRAPTRRPTR